jgi:quinol monooxygenase YgiN
MENVMSYVVLAELRGKPERIEEFEAFMERHAAASRAEPGCLVFDVCRDPADPQAFVLYEVYSDEAAYQAHRATAHYERFSREAGAMLEHTGESLLVSRRVLSRR